MAYRSPSAGNLPPGIQILAILSTQGDKSIPELYNMQKDGPSANMDLSNWHRHANYLILNGMCTRTSPVGIRRMRITRKGRVFLQKELEELRLALGWMLSYIDPKPDTAFE